MTQNNQAENKAAHKKLESMASHIAALAVYHIRLENARNPLPAIKYQDQALLEYVIGELQRKV